MKKNITLNNLEKQRVKFIINILISIFIITSSKSIAQENLTQTEDLQISFIGDIIVHEAPYQHVIEKKYNSFKPLWNELIPELQNTDLLFGNLEGPTAETITHKLQKVPSPGFVYDKKVFSGTDFLFNYHPQLLKDLKESGFDILGFANNHTFDRGADGIDLTLDSIEKNNLISLGARKKSSNETFVKTINIKGFNLAWIACTEFTNGFKDRYNQTLLCRDQKKQIIDLIQNLKKADQHDLIILTPHWGDEYQLTPNVFQKKLAKAFIESGVDIIVGSHPHVLQPYERIERPDQTLGLVFYSLGNFLAYQRDIERRSSVILKLKFKKIQKNDNDTDSTLASAQIVDLQKQNRLLNKKVKFLDFEATPIYRERFYTTLAHNKKKVVQFIQMTFKDISAPKQKNQNPNF